MLLDCSMWSDFTIRHINFFVPCARLYYSYIYKCVVHSLVAAWVNWHELNRVQERTSRRSRSCSPPYAGAAAARGLRLARSPSWILLKAAVSRCRFGAGRALFVRQYPSDQRCCAVSGNRVRPTSSRVVSRPTRRRQSNNIAVISQLTTEPSFHYLIKLPVFLVPSLRSGSR